MDDLVALLLGQRLLFAAIRSDAQLIDGFVQCPALGQWVSLG